MLLTIGSLIVVLGVLIFVHELGHYLAARAVGIYVIRFSFGLGPKTPLAVKIGETEYCLSWVPFGGYVKMAGLEEEGPTGELEGGREDAHVPKERTFDAKPLWARVLVISAGVIMNAAFAVVVYAALAFTYGVRHDGTLTVGEVRTDRLPTGAAHLASLRPGDRIVRIDGDSMTGWRDVQMAVLTRPNTPLRLTVEGRADPVLLDVPAADHQGREAVLEALIPWHDPVLGAISPGSPAAAAGLAVGDRIVRAGADTVESWERLVPIIEAHPEQPLPLAVERGGRLLTIVVTPRGESRRDTAGVERWVGKAGVGLRREVRRFGLGGAVVQGFVQTGDAAGLIVLTLKGLVLRQLSARDIGGPILIGQLSGEAARLGVDVFLDFLALFSVNLAVLNLLPIPVLDGGHLVFLFLEGIRRKPVSAVARQRWMTVGLAVVLLLMGLAVFNDVVRLFR